MKDTERVALKLLELAETLLSDLHSKQVAKSLSAAKKLIPELTPEDILNPDSFAALQNDRAFIYEDGIAAGILSAKIAIRTSLLDLIRDQ